MSDTAAPLAHLAEDPAVISDLLDMYIGAYTAGAFTAIFNLDPVLLDAPPVSEARSLAAQALAYELGTRMTADPAVMLTLERGVTAFLRGERPDHDVMSLS